MHCWHMILQRSQNAAREMDRALMDLDLDPDPMEFVAVAADGGDRGAPAAGGTGRQGPALTDLDPSAGTRQFVVREAALGLLGCIALDTEDSFIRCGSRSVLNLGCRRTSP